LNAALGYDIQEAKLRVANDYRAEEEGRKNVYGQVLIMTEGREDDASGGKQT